MARRRGEPDGRRVAWRSAALLAILVALPGLPLAGPVAAFASGTHSAALPDGSPSPTQNISSQMLGPTGYLLPGDRIGFRYQVSLPAYQPSWGNLTVWVPASQANFQTTVSTLVVPLGARNISIDSAGYASNNGTSGMNPVSNVTVFRPTAEASFSTLQAAPMTPLPFRSVALLLQWQWLELTADGRMTNSSWWPVAGAPSQPAQEAQLVSEGPRQVAPGGNLTACLDGPLANRTFSLHILTLEPYDDFAEVNGTAPSDGPPPFCLSITVPSFVSPVSATIRLWDLAAPNVTLLLYSMHIHILNGSVLNAPSGTNWTLVGNGAAVVIGLGGLAAVAVLTVQRRPPRSKTSRTP